MVPSGYSSVSNVLQLCLLAGARATTATACCGAAIGFSATLFQFVKVILDL